MQSPTGVTHVFITEATFQETFCSINQIQNVYYNTIILPHNIQIAIYHDIVSDVHVHVSSQ